ncbi:MAG: hypothetical protein ACE5OQ_14460 [Woeseia sp.]
MRWWTVFAIVFLLVAADGSGISPIMFLLAAIVVFMGYRESRMSVGRIVSMILVYLTMATTVAVAYAAL